MRKLFGIIMILSITVGIAFSAKTVKIARSLYVGWSPWAHMEKSGLAQQWGNAYGTQFDFDFYQDYLGSVIGVGTGLSEGCTMTNLEAFASLAAAGVDVTAVIMGDYSNGNDAVIMRGGYTLETLPASSAVLLVEGSLSQYLFEEGMKSVGRSPDEFRYINTTDRDIENAFRGNEDILCVVTWNPMVMNICSDVPGARNVYSSKSHPGEVMDMLVVKTDLVRKNPDAIRALVGMWYDGMKDMQSRTPAGKQARFAMARDQVAEEVPDDEALLMFENQLQTTMMFYEASQAAAYMQGTQIKAAMSKVLPWIDGKDFGDGPIDAGSIGVEFPDGSVIGNNGNVKLRFNSSFTQEYANGQLKK